MAHETAREIGKGRIVKPEDLSEDGWLFKAMLRDHDYIRQLEAKDPFPEAATITIAGETRPLCDKCGAAVKVGYYRSDE